MTWLRCAVTLALVASLVAPVHGDGMLLVPSDVLNSFSEPSQLAVLEVKPDRTVAVDLFISLMDTSSISREVFFVLPLQSMPGEFHVQEPTAEQFAKEHLEPLDAVVREAAAARMKYARDVQSWYSVGSLLAGPLAYVGRYVGPPARALEVATMIAGAAEPPLSGISVRTEHATVDVYPALSPDQLVRLAGLPAIPRIVGQTIDRYAGRPFALVRLLTVPYPARRRASGDGRLSRVRVEAAERGVHFAFAQDMELDQATGAHGYDFPLGTGTAWAQPIGLAQICVTGPVDLNLDVRCPDRPPDLNAIQKSSSLRSTVVAAARGRQVQMATYWEENPDGDVEVRLLPGESRLMAREGARGWQRAAGRIGLPLLGALAWVLAFRLMSARDDGFNRGRFWATLGLGWAAAQIVLLLPTNALSVRWYWSSMRLRDQWEAGPLASWQRAWWHFASGGYGEAVALVVPILVAALLVAGLWLLLRRQLAERHRTTLQALLVATVVLVATLPGSHFESWTREEAAYQLLFNLAGWPAGGGWGGDRYATVAGWALVSLMGAAVVWIGVRQRSSSWLRPVWRGIAASAAAAVIYWAAGPALAVTLLR